MSKKRKLKVDFGERMAWMLLVEATDLEHYAARPPTQYEDERAHQLHLQFAMEVKGRALTELVRGYGLNLDTLSYKARERYDEMIAEQKKKHEDHEALMAECERIRKEHEPLLEEARRIIAEDGGTDGR